MVRQAELIRQAQDGDKKARDKVVSDNLGLVHAIVRRFEKRGHDREELFQIGCIGLIKAIDRDCIGFHVVVEQIHLFARSLDLCATAYPAFADIPVSEYRLCPTPPSAYRLHTSLKK